MANKIDLKVGLKDETQAGWGSITSQAGRAMSGIKSAIAAAVGASAIVAFGKNLLSTFGEIADMADNLNVSTDALQAFQAAGLQTGNSIDDVRKSLEKLKQAQSDVFTNDKLASAFAALGLSARDVAQSLPEDLFSKVGLGLKNSTNEVEAFNAITEIFGAKTGPRMVAMLKEAAGALSTDFVDAAKRAGNVLDEELVRKADKVDDKLKMLWARFKVGAADFIGWVVKGPKNPVSSEDKKAADEKRRSAQAAAGEAAQVAKLLAEAQQSQLKEIDAANKKAADEIKESEHKAMEGYKKLVREDGEKAAQEIRNSTELMVDSLRQRAAKMASGARITDDRSAAWRNRALSKDADRAARKAERERDRDDKRFQELVNSAGRKLEHNARGMSQQSLTASEAAAVQSVREKALAGEREGKAKELEAAARKAEIESAKSLKEIEKKIQDALSIAEG